MSEQLIAWIIMGVAFLPYWITCLYLFGLSDTISETWYRWDSYGKKWISVLGKAWFIFMLLGASTPLFAFIPESSDLGVLVLLSVGGLWLVAATPNFRVAYIERYHVAGAIVGCLFTQISLMLVMGFWQPFIGSALIGGGLALSKSRYAGNITETVAFMLPWLFLSQLI